MEAPFKLANARLDYSFCSEIQRGWVPLFCREFADVGDKGPFTVSLLRREITKDAFHRNREREKERERKKGLFSFHIRRRQSTDGPFRLPELGLRRFLKFRFRIQLRFQNIWDSYRILVNPTPGIRQIIQSRALGHFQGFVKSFLGCSTGRWAILQLLCSQARRKLKEELFKKNKQNLQKQPNAGRCMWERKLSEIDNRKVTFWCDNSDWSICSVALLVVHVANHNGSWNICPPAQKNWIICCD